MTRFGILWLLFLCLNPFLLGAQVAPDCLNAVPICSDTPINGGTTGYGIDDFTGVAQSGCLERTTSGLVESNSAWYRFRTGASGQLGFNIGFDTQEDWDFALYRSDDCGNLGAPVRCNFFDNQDERMFMGVGEDPTGASDTVLYEDWLQVAPGEDYYLLINNFSNYNSGFSIQFSGQIFVTNPYDALDCAIINNLLGPPVAACQGDLIPLDATTPNAIDYSWFQDTGTGFQPLIGENGPTLDVTNSAMYRVVVAMPMGSTIISDVQVAFSPLPMAEPVTHEVVCTDVLTFDLTTKDAEVLGAQNPSDFVVSYHASFTEADNGLNPLPKAQTVSTGLTTYHIRLTSLQNPNCYDASQEFRLFALQTPELDFPEDVFICEDSQGVVIGEQAPNSTYTYQWDDGTVGPTRTVSVAGTYSLTVTHSQAGFSCTNSRSVRVVVSEAPAIAEVIIEDLQANNTVTVVPVVVGDFEYQMDTGDFQSSNSFYNIAPGLHTVTINDLGGCGSVTEDIVVMGFPKFFTPNGDGANDRWQVVGLDRLDEPVISIFDRFGKLITQLDATSPGWDGTYQGQSLPASDYWFKLSYFGPGEGRQTAKFIHNHFSLRR